MLTKYSIKINTIIINYLFLFFGSDLNQTTLMTLSKGNTDSVQNSKWLEGVIGVNERTNTN